MIKTVTEKEDLVLSRKLWNSLLIKSESNSVYLTHQWIMAWWNSFGSGHKLHVLMIYEEERLVGIAPFMQTTAHYRGVPVDKLMLIANGHSPASGIIAHEKDMDRVVHELLSYLKLHNKWDIVDIHKMPRDSSAYQFLIKHLDAMRLEFGIKDNIESPYILIDTDWKTFLGKRSSKLRKVLRNKINRVNKSGDVTIERETITDRTHAALQDMITISEKSWKKQIYSDLESNPVSREFHLQLCDQFGPEGSVELWILRMKDVPVAFEFHLIYNEIAYPIRADYDEGYSYLSPGSVLEYNILKTFFESSTPKEYYSCGHTYNYLLNWTDTSRKHINVEIFNRYYLPHSLYFIEYKLFPVLRKMGFAAVKQFFYVQAYGKSKKNN